MTKEIIDECIGKFAVFIDDGLGRCGVSSYNDAIIFETLNECIAYLNTQSINYGAKVILIDGVSHNYAGTSYSGETVHRIESKF